MTNGGVLQVDTDALRTHAGQIAGIAQGLDEGVRAGVEAALDNRAFGVLCSFMVPSAILLQGAGIAALMSTAATLAGTDVGLRAAAKCYDEVDQAVEGRLTKLLEDLS